MLLGIDFSEHSVAVILADAEGRTLVALRGDLPRVGGASAQWLAAMDVVRQALLQNHTVASQISCAGLSFFAPLDENGVVVKDGRAPGWANYDLPRALREHLQLPQVFVVPQVLAEAIAEERFGALRPVEDQANADWLYVHLGGTIRGMARTGGVLLRGFHGASLEIGAICIERDGELSSTGRRGSLDAYCSSDAFITRARSYGLTMSTPREIWEMTTSNFMAKSLCDDYIERLAQGLGATLAVLSPPRLVLGGSLGVELGEKFITPLQATLHEYCLPSHLQNLEISAAQLGRDAGVLGVVSLARDGGGVVA